MMTSVLDNKGELCLVGWGYHVGGVKYGRDRHGNTTIKSYIVLPDGDTYVQYLPVITEWFDKESE